MREGIHLEILYSDMPPARIHDGQQTFLDAFHQAAQKADAIDIAVGYGSRSSLNELRNIISKYHLHHLRVNLGMYLLERKIPERMYHTALHLHQLLRKNQLGEVLLVRPFKFHGKLYAFYKNGKPFCAFIGSHNLSALKLEATNRRQYEISAKTDNPAEVDELATFIRELAQAKFSLPIDEIKGIELDREENTSLRGVEFVSEIPDRSVQLYHRHCIGTRFELPLKVPAFAERFLDDGKHFTKSNINVCYAAPRSKRKNRDWYETQLTVSIEVRKLPGFPEKNHPFFVITDDGYFFKAHTTSDGNKQFSAVNDELIMGRWLKGRLAAAGLVTPVNDTGKDTERLGMITKEMLDEYGADSLVFQRTDLRAADEDDTELDVWYLSFETHREDEQP